MIIGRAGAFVNANQMPLPTQSAIRSGRAERAQRERLAVQGQGALYVLPSRRAACAGGCGAAGQGKWRAIRAGQTPFTSRCKKKLDSPSMPCYPTYEHMFAYLPERHLGGHCRNVLCCFVPRYKTTDGPKGSAGARAPLPDAGGMKKDGRLDCAEYYGHRVWRHLGRDSHGSGDGRGHGALGCAQPPARPAQRALPPRQPSLVRGFLVEAFFAGAPPPSSGFQGSAIA